MGDGEFLFCFCESPISFFSFVVFSSAKFQTSVNSPAIYFFCLTGELQLVCYLADMERDHQSCDQQIAQASLQSNSWRQALPIKRKTVHLSPKELDMAWRRLVLSFLSSCFSSNFFSCPLLTGLSYNKRGHK